MADDVSVTIRCSAAARDRFNMLAALASRSAADVLETLSYAGFDTLLQCNNERVLAEHKTVEQRGGGEVGLTDRFEKAMENLCRAEERYGYRAKFLPKMLRQYGGVPTAKRLLSTGANWQQGFEKLRQGGHLHISVENLVLFGEFPRLFQEEELDEARRRLGAAGFDPKGDALAAELDDEVVNPGNRG